MSERGRRILVSALAAAGVVLAAATVPRAATAQSVGQRSAEATDAGAHAAGSPSTESGGEADHPAQWALLEQRCSKCHNSTDWAGGLAFDTLFAEDIPADAETWEKAVRKLRGRMMPPPGQPQPEQQTVDSFVSWMEGQLDHASAAQPDPGQVGLHRLNRTEYAREIDRLLGLTVDVQTLLPRDVSSDGFDNVAATLRISPAFLEQYISAARNISRQAIGRANAKPSTRQVRVASDADQNEHIDGLPLGTRGGMLVEHYFPADGEYEFNIREFFFGGAGYVTKVDAAQRVILTIDDVRVFDGEFGGPTDLKAVDQEQAIAADQMQNRFNHIRVKVKAGERRVGVTFVQRSFAESESPLQPVAMLPEMERVPAIPGVDISGPFNVSGVGETESRKRVFICTPASAAEEQPCAQRILGRLAGEAFRRPATNEDLKAPLAFYTEGRTSGDFEAGIESGLTAILSSTKFLFRAERSADNVPGTARRVSDLELASRLSFFLWSEGPDQPLIELAAAGRLNDAAVLAAQVHRMLADPRAQSLVTNFAFQWLNVNKMDTTQPDPVVYPDFDRDLREGYRQEIRLFLTSVLLGNRSVLDLLRSDETFLNERVAIEYGVPNVRGAQFRAVRLTDPNRFGLLGKGAVLMGTSYGNRTSPVLRGAWILENITGTPPTAPPPGVEAFKETEPGKKAQTVRERLESHRANPSCNACHGVMDPLGFALENFDVVGAWRDRDRDAGSVIDSSGRLSNGTQISGPTQLRNALLARPDQFVQALTEKLMVFALGRGLRYQDMPMVRAVVRQAAGNDYRFETLVAGVVSSPAFQLRAVPVTESAPPRPAHATTQAALTSADRSR